MTEELWQLALHTLDRDVCTCITDDLMATNALTGDQTDAVTFWREINQLYPCRSFELVKQAMMQHARQR